MNISIHVDPKHDGVDLTTRGDEFKANVSSVAEAIKLLETFSEDLSKPAKESRQAIGYKVCRKPKGLLPKGAFQTDQRYRLGGWVGRPACSGPLSVFATLDNAVSFLRMYPKACDLVIYLCEFVPSQNTKLWKPGLTCTMSLPDGTLFADAVKLLERIGGEH